MIWEIGTWEVIHHGQEPRQGKTDLASSHISIPGQVHSVMMRVPSEGIQR